MPINDIATHDGRILGGVLAHGVDDLIADLVIADDVFVFDMDGEVLPLIPIVVNLIDGKPRFLTLLY